MNLAAYLDREIDRIPGIVSRQYREAEKSNVRLRSGWVTGSGDSFAAALALQYMSDFSFIAADPLELGRISGDEGEQLVAISVKGRTIKVVEVAEKMAGRGTEVIAVTAVDSSPLATSSSKVVKLVYGGGEQPVGVGNYAAAIAALGSLTGHSIDGMLRAYRRALNSPLPEIYGEVVAVGEFEGYANSLFTCLKLYECACLPCRFYRAEQFMHAPIYSPSKNSTILVFATSGGSYARRVAEILRGSGFPATYLDFGGGIFGNLIAGAVYAARLAKAYIDKMGLREPCFASRSRVLYESTRSIYYGKNSER